MYAGSTNETGSVSKVRVRTSDGKFVYIDPFFEFAEPGKYYYINTSKVENTKTIMAITIPLVNMLILTVTVLVTLGYISP